MWVRVLAVVAAIAVAGSAYVLARPTAPPAGQAPPVAISGAAPTPEVAATTPPAPPSQPPPTAAPTPTTPPATEVRPGEQRVVARLSAIVANSRAQPRLAVTVTDQTGRPLFAHAATTPVLPASTQKLTVAGAALAQFGSEHRYTTTVTSAAQPDAQGVLHGDLVLVGAGDPALAQPLFASVEPERPRTPIESLAAQIKRAGVRQVTGRILGDDGVLADEPVAAGWRPRYFDELDATRISGLTVDAGRRMFQRSGVIQATAAEDPARQAALVLRQLLVRRGIRVRGGAAAASDATGGAVLASVSSPPMGALLEYMVQRSDNHLADTIFRTLGAARGDSTWIGAAGATAEILGPLQLDWSGVVLADGSGLSRANRLSTDFLSQLEARMWQSNLRSQWVELLALSGRRGTLRHRFLGTVAERNVYGKTGSLRDVTALVGTVTGTRGRRLHFAVVGNRLETSEHVRATTDRLVVAMAEELHDCRRVPRPPRKNGKPRPPRLVCDGWIPG